MNNDQLNLLICDCIETFGITADPPRQPPPRYEQYIMQLLEKYSNPSHNEETIDLMHKFVFSTFLGFNQPISLNSN